MFFFLSVVQSIFLHKLVSKAFRWWKFNRGARWSPLCTPYVLLCTPPKLEQIKKKLLGVQTTDAHLPMTGENNGARGNTVSWPRLVCQKRKKDTRSATRWHWFLNLLLPSEYKERSVEGKKRYKTLSWHTRDHTLWSMLFPFTKLCTKWVRVGLIVSCSIHYSPHSRIRGQIRKC